MSKKKSLPSKILLSPFIVLLITMSAVLFTGVSAASASTISDDTQAINYHPVSTINQSLLQGGAAVAAATTTTKKPPKIQTIPYWGSSFDYLGTNYPYTMVGTNPAKGSDITIVPTEVIPVKLILSDGSVWNGERKVRDTLNSPLFRPSSFTSGYTQYGDAIQRAEFWKYVTTKSPFYHVFLAPPRLLPTLTVNVPADQGKTITRPSGTVFGSVDINYLDNIFQTYMQQHHISARTLPIFLASDVLETDAQGTLCCIGGYHNAVANADNTVIQTYAYATYNDPGFSVKNPKVFTTTDALSHEISEWYNDPFGNNVVPFWSVPAEPQYGCNNALEVGDPLVGVGFDVGKYHLQDEAFFSWFSHQTPSIGQKGRYSYLGTFTTPAQVCQP